jgi:hypothetical protein
MCDLLLGVPCEQNRATIISSDEYLDDGVVGRMLSSTPAPRFTADDFGVTVFFRVAVATETRPQEQCEDVWQSCAFDC